MANFGVKHPAFWIPSKTQMFNIKLTQTVTAGVSSLIEFYNAHAYETGMMIYINMTLTTGQTYRIWAYITAVNPFQILINYDVGNHTASGEIIDITFGQATGYIGLEFAKVETDYIANDNLVNTSVVTGKVWTTNKGYYSTFLIPVNLLKYDLRYSATLRVSVSNLLKKYNGTNVYLFPHIDRPAIQNKSLENAVFNLSTQFDNISSIDFRDLASLQFAPQEYTSLQIS